MKFIFTCILTSLLFIAFNSFGQTDSAFLTRTINSLEKYSLANPVEKVYLHLDKTGYMPGDTIWFKAYVVAGENHGLSAISNVLHVELLNEIDTVISRIALPLSSGIGWGDFALPVLIKPGIYQIRAYTNWMRNFGPEYFFDQLISVQETSTLAGQKKQKVTGDLDVQFFPEGGLLINGLRNKVAVKAVANQGLGEDVNGSVIDNDGNEVAIFSTQHSGMGVFAVIPQAGKSYKAKITRKGGKQFTASLPKAQDEGFAIAVNSSQSDSISIRVAASAKLFDTKKGARYYLLAQSGAKVYYTAGFKLLAQSFTTRIDKKRFPTGIVQFTLFADNGEPLNERIAFIQHYDQLKLNIISAKDVYATRQKVSIAIKGTDKDNKAVVGSFSAAVVNEDLMDISGTSEKNSILSNLLLTSDVKGYIEQPDYYFTNVSDKTKADLDLLMLTQGYHRFEWKQVTGGTYPALTFEPETSLTVSGYVQKPDGKPIPNSKMMLYSIKGGWFRLDTLANESGKFTFKRLVTDQDTTIRYLIQGRTPTNGKNLVITLDTIAPFKARKNNDSFDTPLSDTTALTPYQKQMRQRLKVSLDKRTILLKEVSIREVKAPLSGNIIPDQTIRVPKNAIGTIGQYLSSRAVGVIFKNGVPYSTRGGIMNIILDGFPINKDYFASLNLDEIEGAEILRTTGRKDIATGLGNAIILTRRKYSGYTKQLTPDVITFPSNGFYKAKEFYSPKYDGPKTNMQTLDLRTTIYWKPDIVTDKDGNTNLSFFNADTKGTYRITVEGIDIDGNIGHQVFTYKVE